MTLSNPEIMYEVFSLPRFAPLVCPGFALNPWEVAFKLIKGMRHTVDKKPNAANPTFNWET